LGFSGIRKKGKETRSHEGGKRGRGKEEKHSVTSPMADSFPGRNPRGLGEGEKAMNCPAQKVGGRGEKGGKDRCGFLTIDFGRSEEK